MYKCNFLAMKIVLLSKGELIVKKIFSILLTIICLMLVACGDSNTSSKGEVNNKTEFTQEVTIVKMPSPPKCKTTTDSSVVNEILNLLNKMEKSPTNTDVANGGWTTMIKINIDGQEFNYTIGSVFTDSDGRQYNVKNHREIEDKVTKIYNELDVPEVDYP